MKVTYSPASSVQSISFSRAGITSSLNPSFESSPSTSTSISLLATFQESTNLIPFTLDAPSPGNQVAHLVVTLAASAPPGSTISLTLDPAVTQLTDQGGSAATKESPGNGNLTLVNGSITVPQVSMTMSPISINVGTHGTMTINASAAMPSTTTITLTSANPAVATVPASVDMQQGFRVASFTVNGLTVGSSRITATLPPSVGSGTVSANANVTAVSVCNTPVAPQISAPEGAEVGAAYSVSWAAVSDTSEYLVDEATNADFTDAATTTVTTTSASFTHTSNNTRYYYRVRAHNRASTCDLTSPNSNTVSVLIGHPPPLTVTPMRVLPVVGSVAGASGSFFKTSVQLYNPRDVAVSGKIVFHTQGVSGNSSDPSLAYSLQPKKTLSYTDLLPAMGIAGGLGTADIVPDSTSPLPISLVRVFNDAGAAGTSGLTEDSMSSGEALQQGDTGALLAPADIHKFRLNIGIRTLDQGVTMDISVRDADGNVVKTLTSSYDPTFFTQQGSSAIIGGYVLTGGETISFTITNGSAFIYGATTDNTTNDPSVQFARRVE